MSIKFIRKGEWYMQSTCGRLYISKGKVFDTPWYLLHQGGEIIGERHATAEAAIKAANEWQQKSAAART